MNINEILDQIERGLEGVTPGPWRRKPMKGYTDDYVLTDHPDFQQPKHGNLVAECGFSSGKVEHRYEADAAHIARCDPDTMRAIIVHIRELEARNRELETLTDELDFLRHEGGPDSVAFLEQKVAAFDAMQARAEKAEDKVAMLREALEPLADQADIWGDQDEIGPWSYIQDTEVTTEVTVGALRRVRAALAAMENTDE